MSRLEQRRAQQQNLIRSVVLAGLGILAIVLVLVPGQSFWNVLRSWLFGAFGVVTYFVGPFLLYLAYLLGIWLPCGHFHWQGAAAGGAAGRYSGHLLGL